MTLRACAAFCALVMACVQALAADPKAPLQYVIISFDGAHDLAQWERSRALAEKTGATFTYFLSCVFLLSPETRGRYRPPEKGLGRSNVGFAQSRQEVADRLRQIWSAHQEGHEIASHGCGHFDGRKWTKAQWLHEFSAFSTVLRDAYSLNGIEGEPQGWRTFADDIAGFRAPYLSVNEALYTALKQAGFAYDASGVSRGPAEPVAGDLVRFALPQVPEGPSARPVIAMDYNLFVRHSRGKEDADNATRYEQRAYRAFRSAFEAEYRGARRPLSIGFHFTLMNGGAYWNALERFATEVCREPQVACVSYRDYLARALPVSSGS